MNIIELNSIKVEPDIVQEYPQSLSRNAVPLVIDNGSYECRVGWATSDQPLLNFRNLIAKPRKEKQKKDGEIPLAQPIQIGNDIVNIEAIRYQLRTQFDRNVVTHYHNQEQIFDYIFKHLGIDAVGNVPHPIFMTECFANPNYCRQLMNELLFECYDVPAVSYGIDSLYSFQHNGIGGDGLLVSFGYYTIHVIPVLDGQMQADRTRRINLGGFHMINFLHRLLQMKYPVHTNAILLSRVEWLLQHHCSVAYDYMDELRNWAGLAYYEENVKKIQLPYNVNVSSSTTLSAEQKIEKKKESGRRLADINARKREERLQEDETKLNQLKSIQQLFNAGKMDDFKKQLRANSISNRKELENQIQTIIGRIERIKQKIGQIELSLATGTTIVADEKIPQPPVNKTVNEWVTEVKRKRTSLLERRTSRKQRKLDMAKRRTVAAQERMRIISQLARREKGEDDFGMRDEDWDVYKAISKNGDSDSDMENEKLLEFEEILRHHDPAFEEPQIVQEGTAESYQLHLGVESIRAPELIFQPSMIGSSEAGLAETINYILTMFTADEQQRLVNNIFLTGAGAKFPGLRERLSREMTEMRPFQSTHRIIMANAHELDAWYGAKKVAATENINQYLTTRSDYNEFGSEYFKEHIASNRFVKTPALVPTATADTANI